MYKPKPHKKRPRGMKLSSKGMNRIAQSLATAEADARRLTLLSGLSIQEFQAVQVFREPTAQKIADQAGRTEVTAADRLEAVRIILDMTEERLQAEAVAQQQEPE